MRTDYLHWKTVFFCCSFNLSIFIQFLFRFVIRKTMRFFWDNTWNSDDFQFLTLRGWDFEKSKLKSNEHDYFCLYLQTNALHISFSKKIGNRPHPPTPPPNIQSITHLLTPCTCSSISFTKILFLVGREQIHRRGYRRARSWSTLHWWGQFTALSDLPQSKPDPLYYDPDLDQDHTRL